MAELWAQYVNSLPFALWILRGAIAAFFVSVVALGVTFSKVSPRAALAVAGIAILLTSVVLALGPIRTSSNLAAVATLLNDERLGNTQREHLLYRAYSVARVTFALGVVPALLSLGALCLVVLRKNAAKVFAVLGIPVLALLFWNKSISDRDDPFDQLEVRDANLYELDEVLKEQNHVTVACASLFRWVSENETLETPSVLVPLVNVRADVDICVADFEKTDPHRLPPENQAHFAKTLQLRQTHAQPNKQ